MSLINIAQVIVSFIVVGLILLQERSSGIGGIFGGEGGGMYHARRGLEKLVFAATVGFVIIFAAIALSHLL